MTPTLSILICTINDRINDVADMLLTPRKDVTYIVSFQYTDTMFLNMIPQVLKDRIDVEILPHPTTGLSLNRNTALSACRSELALVADDDTRYTHEQIDLIINTFRDNPDVEIACFKAQFADGTPLKAYPEISFDYKHTPRGYYYSSIELAFRTDTQLPQFDTRFGLGATFLNCGEEEVFLYHAHCAGLNIRYFPYTMATTRTGETTGARFANDKRARRSKGATLIVIHGIVGGLLRIIKTAVKLPENRWRALCDMVDGYKYILQTD